LEEAGREVRMPMRSSVVLVSISHATIAVVLGILPLLIIERLSLLEELFDKTQELGGTGLASNTRKVLQEVCNELLGVIQKTGRVFLGGLVRLPGLVLFIERHDGDPILIDLEGGRMRDEESKRKFSCLL
jgi:hypothetical protein